MSELGGRWLWTSREGVCHDIAKSVDRKTFKGRWKDSVIRQKDK